MADEAYESPPSSKRVDWGSLFSPSDEQPLRLRFFHPDRNYPAHRPPPLSSLSPLSSAHGYLRSHTSPPSTPNYQPTRTAYRLSSHEKFCRGTQPYIHFSGKFAPSSPRSSRRGCPGNRSSSHKVPSFEVGCPALKSCVRGHTPPDSHTLFQTASLEPLTCPCSGSSPTYLHNNQGPVSDHPPR